MAVSWGELTWDNQKLIVERAKDLRDGIFSYRGIIFRVRNGRATHFAAQGKVVEPYGAFNVEVGRYNFADDREAKRLLKNIKD